MKNSIDITSPLIPWPSPRLRTEEICHAQTVHGKPIHAWGPAQHQLHQCSRKASTERPFVDNQSHPCCGLHARQYDQIVTRRKEGEDRRAEEQKLLLRLNALNIPNARLHYTITGKSTTSVVVELTVLEALLRRERKP